MQKEQRNYYLRIRTALDRGRGGGAGEGADASSSVIAAASKGGEVKRTEALADLGGAVVGRDGRSVDEDEDDRSILSAGMSLVLMLDEEAV